MNMCLKCSHKNFMKCAGPPCEGVCECVSKYICDPLHKCKCCRSKKSDEEVPLDPKTDMVRFKKYAKRKSSKKSIKKSNKKLKSIKKSKKKSVRKNKL